MVGNAGASKNEIFTIYYILTLNITKLTYHVLFKLKIQVKLVI